MNRREALKRCGVAVAATMAAGGLSFTVAGCTSVQIENEINVILQGIANILAVSGQTSWSKALSSAEQALAQAETTWKSGGAAQILIDALNTVEAVTAVIPLTDQYSDFIDVIVAAIETVITLLEPTTQATANAALGTKKTSDHANPHKGRIADFKSGRQAAKKWNATSDAYPYAHVAKVKVPL